VDFIIVLIELFSLGVTAESVRANIDWKSAFLKGVGQFRPNFHVIGNISRETFLHGCVGFRGLRGNVRCSS